LFAVEFQSDPFNTWNGMVSDCFYVPDAFFWAAIGGNTKIAVVALAVHIPHSERM